MSNRERMPAAERREQIYDEASRIIGQRGFYGFSIQDVAEECGLTVAGLLHHVGSKDKLLIGVLETRDQRDLAAVSGWHSLTDAEPGPRTVSESVDLLHKLVMRNATQPEIVRLYSILRVESLYPGHPAHEYFRDRDASVLHSFATLFTGSVTAPDAFARQLLALMGGLEEQWLRDPRGIDFVAEWDAAIATVLDGALR